MSEGLNNALTGLVGTLAFWMCLEIVYKAISLFAVIRGEFRRKELEDKAVEVIKEFYRPDYGDKN